MSWTLCVRVFETTFDLDNDSGCFGDGNVHIINVVRSSGRVVFV